MSIVEGHDFLVEQQRLRWQIAAQLATVEQQRYSILEMADRKRKHEENITAATKAVEKMRSDLRAIEEAHGKLDESYYEKLKDSLG